MEREQLYASGSVHGEVLVITVLAAEVDDEETSRGLHDEIFSLVDCEEPSHVVIDLRRVTFMGSVGFLMFLALRRRLGAGQIVICNITQPVYDLFEVCRLFSTSSTTGPFEAEESLEAALARFSG